MNFPIREVLEDLDEKRFSALSGVPPAAAAWLAASLPDPGRLVIVTPDQESADRFCSDLAFFLPGSAPAQLGSPQDQPYDETLPDVELAAGRISALNRLSAGLGPVVIPAPALVQPVPPPAFISEASVTLRTGEVLDREGLIRSLTGNGYRRVAAVAEPGDMAVRGGIVDLFTPGLEEPVRVELWGDDIQSIRTFSPEDQRSRLVTDSVTVLPVTEIVRGGEISRSGRQRLDRFLASSGVKPRYREQVLSQWDQGKDFPGICLYLPVIYGSLSRPLDHIGEGTRVLLLEPAEVRASIHRFCDLAVRRAKPGFPSPGDLYPGDPAAVLYEHPVIEAGLFASGKSRALAFRPALSDALPTSRPDRIAELVRTLEAAGDERVVLAAHSPSAADRIFSVLRDLGLETQRVPSLDQCADRSGPCLITGALSAGFSCPDVGVTFISDGDIFGPVTLRRPRRLPLGDWDLPIGSLVTGDVVVHVEHGIALYKGLKQMDIGGFTGDFIHLEYSGGDALYVPVEDMNRVQKYRSASETPPPLSRLGGTAWKNAKTRVRRALRMMAEELLKLSARRQSAPGVSFPPPETLYREFEASFPWSETPDQERAIVEVVGDMTSARPMDRLVCGDVGFGKTEVALRAAFLAVLGGKQVAVLVPTTVLAQQHFQNFRRRLDSFPVEVGMLSRFVSPREVKKTLGRLREGGLDIVIGTHRLLSADVAFKDLGLVVIDEEHRFGVRHKERLKRIKETVDVLTLSATPIPRTLFQAFSGIRDLSLIHTPPVDRKSVHTEVRYFEEDLIRDAVNRELDRGGQVFIVHNRVMSIEAFGGMVQKLVPHARVSVAHGQMGERDLERVMVDFLRGEQDILISTAIIESGLDISNANTLIVNRADRFGLAQLYQLRGRVGRSATLAYAYLLVPPGGRLSDKARKRLASLQELTELGSGFKLSSYDLEIRGAGNLLGEEQSGNIGAVGLDLYTQLLEQAVRETSGQPVERKVEPKVTLEVPAVLTEDYLPDVGERLTLYKRLAGASSLEELEALREETADRFGRFPAEVLGLFTRMEVIILARKVSAERIDTAGPYYLIVLHPEARISPDGLVSLLSRDSRTRFIPPSTLRLDVSGLAGSDDRIGYLKEILRTL